METEAVEAAPRSRPSPGRAHVRDLVLRLLGVVYLLAFLSLLTQLDVLLGSHGLLPAANVLAANRSFVELPTVFRIDCSDTTLHIGAIAGVVLSLGLAFGLAPRLCLVALWALYLSFVNVGGEFFAFQWDNLLLESAFTALFVAPPGLRPRASPSPHPLAAFLVLWLVFRVHVESGAAKLLLGDPTWRDLTAMVSYYETAPLPTWLGWYAHQMPLWAHRGCALFVYLAELAVPVLIWSGPRVRAVAVLVMLAMQLAVLLTANYGFVNYLTIVLVLFVLDDRQLGWIAHRLGRPLAPRPPPRPSPGRHILLLAAASVVVLLSVLQFFPFVPGLEAVNRASFPVRRLVGPFHVVHAYHLFARMTLVRREVVIEGSDDGTNWRPYEFHYKPGLPERPPPLVAPHQPRVDFQLWFLLFGRRMSAPYFETLLARLRSSPRTVTSLFARDPFSDAPPGHVRVAVYRYRFTDAAARRATGAWWQRELQGYLR
jgi:hypothetical protein